MGAEPLAGCLRGPCRCSAGVGCLGVRQGKAAARRRAPLWDLWEARVCTCSDCRDSIA